MHSQMPPPRFSSPFDHLVQEKETLALYPNPRRGLYLCVGNFIAAAVCTAIALANSGNHRIVGFLLVNLLALMAPVLLLCGIRSLVWLLYELPTLQIEGKSITLYLTGLNPIVLDESEIAAVVLHGIHGAKYHVALDLTAPGVMRQRLSLLDRIYFECSQKITGFGLSYTVSLPSDGDARLLQALKANFGHRVVSRGPELEAMLSRA
jgi:hypothetical protein